MNDKCTVYQTMSFTGKKWTLLILLELHKGKAKWKRYSHLKNKLPKITPKMLSSRLRELNKEKLIEKRIDHKRVPIKCEYALTESGRDFINVIKSLKKWSLKWRRKHPFCDRVNCINCKI